MGKVGQFLSVGGALIASFFMAFLLGKNSEKASFLKKSLERKAGNKIKRAKVAKDHAKFSDINEAVRDFNAR